jgi:putative oxidoreductase
MHWKTPVWATEGGAELPLTNIAIGVALATNEPGRISLDYLLGIKVPKIVTLAVLTGVIAGVLTSEVQTQTAKQSESSEAAEESTES